MSLSYRRRIRASFLPALRTGLLLIVPAATALQLKAEDRKYMIGTTIDLVGGGNRAQTPSLSNAAGSFFYEAYPSVDIRSAGSHSQLEISYAFGLSRFNNDLNYNSNSHAVSAMLSGSVAPKWKLSVADRFQRSSNFATFDATRGILSTANGFVFNPVAHDILTETNNVSFTADYTANEKSSLSLNASHLFVSYPHSEPFNGLLFDQQRVSESITYSQKVTENGGWNLTYDGAYADLGHQFPNTHTHAVSAGYFQQIGHDLTLRLAAGPTYVRTAAPFENYSGYNAHVSVQKPIKSNALLLYYAHESGASTGLGSISDNDRAGFGVSRSIGTNASFFADVSLFDLRSKLGVNYKTRGISTAASVGIPVGRMLSLRWGAQYQRYDEASVFGFEQTRIYISVRFNAPELWKVTR